MSDPNPPDSNPPSPTGPQPGQQRSGVMMFLGFGRKKITSIKVLRLTFKTDHHLMTNNNSDWTNSGSVFPKPDWTYGNASNPITHTKNQKVVVEVDFEVNPANADETDATVTGTATFGSLIFNQITPQKFKGGTVTVSAESTAPLPDLVQALTGSITWSVNTTEDGTFNAGDSWGHTIYLTYSTPSGGSVTQMRIVWVTNAANGKSAEQDCVNAIFDGMDKYKYTLGATPPNPTWLILGGDLADCGILADQFRLACLMLGLPDNFTKGFIYPLAAVGGAKFSTSGADNETRTLSGSHQVNHGAQEKMGFQDGNGGNNNYEGCVKYGTIYYCIGEARYPTPQATMTDMVVFTFWGAMGGGGGVWTFCKNPGPYPIAKW